MRNINTLIGNFKNLIDMHIPVDVASAMLRIQKYKSGKTSLEVYGMAAREGYNDDCKIVSEYFVSRILANQESIK